jgi:hypothetical protein
MGGRAGSSIAIWALAIGGILLTRCGSNKVNIRPDQPYRLDADTIAVAEMDSRSPLMAWQTVDRMLFMQAEQVLDLRRGFGTFWGSPVEAKNINRFDEVPDCVWFTNRIGMYSLSPDDVRLGPAVTPGPDTTGPWEVFRPKVEGQTVGFWIQDLRGDQYIIKFDPAGYPEMATAAAAMGSRFLYACGYNVPQETIVYFRPEWLTVREGASIKDASGRARTLEQRDIDSILTKVHVEPDGRIRALASLSLGKFGSIKGPFCYDGRRKDDPNDWCPHEDRRELRALYVPASLINHYDTKDQNTLDVFIETSEGQGYLRHYLIDFGSTFGSDGSRPKHPRKGYANGFDLKDVLISVVTLGLKTWAWQNQGPVIYPEIGRFESGVFEPQKFDPIVPNPAFDNMTARDGYWGAKIVMGFSDEHLRALVDAGQYSNPDAAAYLLDQLMIRRDKIGRYWFGRVNPLDYFVQTGDSESVELAFVDLAVHYGFQPADHSRYDYAITYRGDRLRSGEMTDPVLTLPGVDLDVLRTSFVPGLDENHLYSVDIRTHRENGGWSKPTRVWLWYHDDTESFEYVGLEHPD